MRVRWYGMLGVIGALSAVGGYWAAEQLSVGPPRQLNVLGPTEVVIDRTDRVQPLEHIFYLNNLTSRPIRIHSVETEACSCLTTLLGADVVPPGETVPLLVRITSFPSESPSYSRTFRVIADGGALDLRVRGNLPALQLVRFRPEIIYLEPIPGKERIDRVVMLRVPKQCCRPLSKDQLVVSGCKGIEFRLVEEAPSETHREFTLHLSVRTSDVAEAAGSLHLETGCGPIHVLVQLPRR